MIKNNLSLKDLEIISKNFLAEIQKSYKGNKTSLRFISHKLSSTPLVKENENFQVMVVGGSILKKALLKKTESTIKILKIENEKNIYFDNENDFLDLISQELYPKIETLALNFAYPLKPVLQNKKMDGTLISSTKGANLHDLVGKKIGKEIEDFVLKKLKRNIKVAVANDTVCLMLSGLTKFNWDKLACGIVGTGMNFALFTDSNHLVNLEAAGFNKFAQTPEGKIADRQSNNPGKSLFEKETAGRYLYEHFNIILKEKNISFPAIKSTEELNRLSLKNAPVISAIAKNLIRKSAQFVACQIVGITEFKKQNMIFIMEGSLFWKGNNYRETVIETVGKLVPEYKADFVEIENSAILGAAKLVC